MVVHTKVLCSFTVVLLMCIQSVAAMDGCVYPETDYNEKRNQIRKPWRRGWRCGDTCLYYRGTCQCGEDGGSNPNQTFIHKQGLWCCTAENCEVVDSYDDGTPKTVKCKNGTTLPLTTQCHSQDPVCNHYGADKWRNYGAIRSHLNICGDNR